MGKPVAVTGNEACAEALRQINPDVCAAYPITPATDLMQRFSGFVNDGKVDTELVLVESEHSAMSACIGAAAAGGRVGTATSSALSAPLNIHGDHSDGMGARDTGWIQLYSENAQEAYDNTIMAFRIAEHLDIRLPAMPCMDGFIVSHSIERVEYIDDADVKNFVGKFEAVNPLLDIDNPKSYGPLILTDLYHEYKRAQHEVMTKVPGVVLEVAAEFEKMTGRKYGLFEEYRLDDAEMAIVVMSSAAGTTKDIVDQYRDKGVKVGLLKPRMFRPFPFEEIAKALQHVKAITVLDRADSFGGYGPLFSELTGAVMSMKTKPAMINKIFGLGGRDYLPDQAEYVIDELIKVAETGIVENIKEYIGVRE
jgi:pyruvate ferredoxin oxidoreductase alpha subunit